MASPSTSTRSSSLEAGELAPRLEAFLQRAQEARRVQVDGLALLAGGASRQTWAFDAVIAQADGETVRVPLVLRSSPRGGGPGAMPPDLEFRLLSAAYAEGVPVPQPYFLADESLGAPALIVGRVEGETIPRRLLRDEEYAGTRRVMAGQLGAILARIHRIPVDKYGLEALPAPPADASPAETEVNRFEQVYRAIAPEPHPAFELAFRWLRQHLPPGGERALVHGDFRVGNVIFGPEGVRAVLDWELAHVGDPVEDLGWICVRSWRFGNDRLPVGGVGTREELVRSYEQAGGFPVDAERVRFWEVFGNLRWGIICIMQARTYLDGRSTSVELAAIGRRTAETEWELLNLMEQD
ncbi:MAG: phosphotransferase family protein [Chloroflexi bacterium]|nr:phosphotransferase family protein [Chloroflexota bacterium]